MSLTSLFTIRSKPTLPSSSAPSSDLACHTFVHPRVVVASGAGSLRSSLKLRFPFRNICRSAIVRAPGRGSLITSKESNAFAFAPAPHRRSERSRRSLRLGSLADAELVHEAKLLLQAITSDRFVYFFTPLLPAGAFERHLGCKGSWSAMNGEEERGWRTSVS